jgi:hypothetical protein
MLLLPRWKYLNSVPPTLRPKFSISVGLFSHDLAGVHLTWYLATKPSFPPGFGTNTLSSKRDSFKLLGSTGASKDQLHTLMEEEEEEEDMADNKENLISSPVSEVSVSVPVPPDPIPSLTRQRPANLSLRPLSLTPENLNHVTSSHGLPTPAQTPNSARGFPFKALALTPSHLSDSDINESPAPVTIGRYSLPTPPCGVARRPYLNINCESLRTSGLDENKLRKRSSISYRTSPGSNTLSLTDLPTPDPTPILTEGRSFCYSSPDDNLPHYRSLSASEQHFLFKSHNALLARITDLEYVLSSRNSRPASVSSEVSSNASLSEPSDEMLQLIADLKAERDDLKRDVDGWRTRVGDLEKQVSIFVKRVEVERRDAWVARSRVGLLEIEKTGLEKALAEKSEVFEETMRKSDALNNECVSLRRCVAELQMRLENRQEMEDECVRLRTALEEERKKTSYLERELDKADILATPIARDFEAKVIAPPAWMTRGLGFTSTDSSVTDVEFSDGSPPKMPLKVVVEEDEVGEDAGNASDISEEDNGLARYEDEQDSDLSFQSLGSSSLGSMDELPRSTLHLQLNPGSFPSISASPTPCVGEVPSTSHVSLSKAWTFPKNSSDTSPMRIPEEVDRFFGCLDDPDTSPPMRGISPNHENTKGLFANALSADDDEPLPFFVLPNGVGIEVEDILASPHALDVVIEDGEAGDDGEEEMDEDIFGEEINGIRITFTPPESEIEDLEPETPVEPVSVCPPCSEEQLAQSRSESPSPPEEASATLINTPVVDDDDDATFNFGRPAPPKPESPIIQKVSRSSIPRLSLSKPFTGSCEFITSTPPKRATAQCPPPSGHPTNGCVTPPTKRGGVMPSFIPQAVSSTSPKKDVSSTNANPAQRASFTRQPQLRPAPVAPRKINNNGSPFKPSLSTPTYFLCP